MYEKNFDFSPIIQSELYILKKLGLELCVFLANGAKISGIVDRFDNFFLKINNEDKSTSVLINVKDILSITYDLNEKN